MFVKGDKKGGFAALFICLFPRAMSQVSAADFVNHVDFVPFGDLLGGRLDWVMFFGSLEICFLAYDQALGIRST